MESSSGSHPPSSILQPQDPRVLLLAGPTAVGKSEIALLLAERLGAEIVSVDSMQVYRGLDIGTAKPSTAELARVRHHLIDVADLADSFDAAQFLRLARSAVADIHARGKVALLCGGTGLYFKAFLQGLGETPPGNLQLRAQLQTTPLPELLNELAERDPVTFERIDRQNPRRIIRAVEVIRLTGKPFSQQRAVWGQSNRLAPSASHFFGLIRSTEDLRRRIAARVDDMFRRGMVAETEQLLRRGLVNNQTAMQALGYRQVAEYLQGVRSLPETIELVRIRTRQFAKRQMTWFRRQLPLTWIHLTTSDAPDNVAKRIAQRFASESPTRSAVLGDQGII
ncbi:MAG TPA: tRNA (adenosine(37)-N6)-dimethylallyltransferase MiaA [Candidatus Acidoferrum sp.]|jgi:tRNA dimethylallyltransferase|nr:tRNA (adenosine(37)-N6)-dimethylallyltransferase MiaA [Candidatus Acidoferrum sp.]